MFKLKKNATFLHDVPIQWPVDGGFEEVQLKVRFRVLDADSLRLHDDLSSEAGQNAYLRAIIVGFPAVIDDDGRPVPDDEALFEQIVGLTFVRAALLRAYGAAMSGARAKN
ncbi:MAG: hypothetical protein ACK4TJ_00050 [Tabrizicola sp.]